MSFVVEVPAPISSSYRIYPAYIPSVTCLAKRLLEPSEDFWLNTPNVIWEFLGPFGARRRRTLNPETEQEPLPTPL